MAGPATWDQTADLEEGIDSDFDTVSPDWDQEANVEEGTDADFDSVSPAWDDETTEAVGATPMGFDSISPAWDGYSDCESATTPFGFDSEVDADGDLASSTANPHDGSRHVRFTFDDTNVMYGQLDANAVNSTDGVWSFWIDPNGVTLTELRLSMLLCSL